MRNIIFISPINYHFNGKISNIQSDVFYHFKRSLLTINANVTIAKFKINRQNYQELDLDFLIRKIKKNSVVLIDGNISIEDNTIYPKELFNILSDSKSKVICFVPDLIKELKFNKWVELSNLIIGFSKDAVNWANEYYRTNKFTFYPSLPLKIYKNQNLKKFLKRPYDIGYIGSDKKFRSKFLNNLKNKQSINLKMMFINSNRDLKNLSSTKSYLEQISKCKFYFCTRASIFENYSSNIFNFNLTEGRFANRVSEAIICGCIPLYWQPKFSNSLFGVIQKKIFYSRKKFIPSNWGLKGDINSRPYDNMDNKLVNGIEVVRDVDDALKKITTYNNSYIKNKLEYGYKIYKNYISPKNFFDFLTARLND